MYSLYSEHSTVSMYIIAKCTVKFKLGAPKDGRIVEDRALGIYPNSVYALYTSLAAVLVLNSNNQHQNSSYQMN